MNEFILPTQARQIVPHREGMCLLDTLEIYELVPDEHAVATACIPEDHFFVSSAGNGPGLLDEAVFVELIAQAYAAAAGYREMSGELSEEIFEGSGPKGGYLVGVSEFKVYNSCSAGQKMTIDVRTTGEFADFKIARGEVFNGAELLASGNVTLWVPNE